MKLSPLFWPIKFKGNTIYILDETLLPHKQAYIKVTNYKQACQAIRDMKTRAVGQVILVFYTFLLVLKQNKGKKDILPVLEKVAREINATRPTLSFKFLTDMLLGWARSTHCVRSGQAKSGISLEKSILGFLEMLKNKRVQQAEAASKLVQNRDVILTHCNVSGSLPLLAEFCRKGNKAVSFFVTETRPYLQGSRLTAWELKKAGFPVTIIADNMVAQVMSEGKINKVIVGADHLAKNGDFANKIGTYQIALLAKNFNIPFYVLCPPASSAETGKDIKIEIRPEKELLEYQGLSLAPKGARGYYPAFDITPNEFITRHIHLELGR